MDNWENHNHKSLALTALRVGLYDGDRWKWSLGTLCLGKIRHSKKQDTNKTLFTTPAVFSHF